MLWHLKAENYDGYKILLLLLFFHPSTRKTSEGHVLLFFGIVFVDIWLMYLLHRSIQCNWMLNYNIMNHKYLLWLHRQDIGQIQGPRFHRTTQIGKERRYISMPQVRFEVTIPKYVYRFQVYRVPKLYELRLYFLLKKLLTLHVVMVLIFYKHLSFVVIRTITKQTLLCYIMLFDLHFISEICMSINIYKVISPQELYKEFV